MNSPDELRAALKAGERRSLELPVDAWARWLLVALYRHLERQRWLGRIAVDRLGADLRRIANFSPHPEPRDGIVPGEPQWSFSFHGNGLSLEHDDGTFLDVDFVDGSPDTIDVFFFGHFLGSLRDPEFIEARFAHDGPSGEAWRVDLVALRQHGLIEGSNRVRLTSSGLEWASVLSEAILTFENTESEHDQIAIAWLIGDPLLALEQGLSDSEIERAADTVRHARTEVLLQKVRSDVDGLCLMALAEVNPDAARQELRRIFTSNSPRQLLRSAHELADFWNAKDLAADVEQGLADENAHPSSHLKAAQLLMRWFGPAMDETLRTKLLLAIGDLRDCSDPAAALIRVLLAPNAGLQEFAQALHQKSEHTRNGAAAGLTLLGFREAIECLREAGTAESSRALQFLNDGQQHLVWWNGAAQIRRVVSGDALNWHILSLLQEACGDLVEQWLPTIEP